MGAPQMTSDTFSKDVGQFSIRVSQPHPRWVEITSRRYGTASDLQQLDAILASDLYDLKYLIDRTIMWLENNDVSR
jgi:hypothetical protein